MAKERTEKEWQMVKDQMAKDQTVKVRMEKDQTAKVRTGRPWTLLAGMAAKQSPLLPRTRRRV
jgi:hypothetical protein